MAKTTQNVTIDALRYYESHPIEFIYELLGVELDTWQETAINTLMEKHYLAIRSGSGVGKTALLSFLLIWFLATKPYAKIPATAPSQHQLYDLLWAECYRWIQKNKYLMNLFNWTQTRIGVRGYEAAWYAVARTASVSPSGDVAEGLQGFHQSGSALLFIVDECSGVPEQVFPAIEGSLSSENCYCILTGNPTRREGYFYDVFHKPQTGKLYAKMHVSCLDSSRVTQHYVDMMQERYGDEHPIYKIKVLGDFPSVEDELLVPPAYLETMQNNSRDTKISPKLPVEIGVDVGRKHAMSIAVVRQGYNVLEIEEKARKRGSITDTIEVVQWVTELINTYDPTVVRVDAIGVGAGVFDLLHKVYGDKIIGVIGGARAADSARYVNIRSQGYWDLRAKIPKLYCAKWPERMIIELSAIRHNPSRNGKMGIESKESMLARSMRSPDYADALMYAFCTAADEYIEVQEFKFSRKVLDINDELSKRVSPFDSCFSGGKSWHSSSRFAMN